MKTETELEATNSQFVALKPNPVQHEEPLRGEADIAQHRRLYCGHYSRCLDVSVREGWSGFTCLHCPLRDYATGGPRTVARDVTR